MKESSKILVLVIIVLAQSKICSKLASDAYNINYRDNELFQKPLSDFFSLDGTSAVSLTPINPDIKIIDYIEKIKEVAEPQWESIHGAKAKISNGRSPTDRLPAFASRIQITDVAGIKCFDLAFSGDNILIDCQNDNNDLLYRYVNGANVELIDSHPILQNGIRKRILQAQGGILARGCLYDALENQINIIEIRIGNAYIQSIDSALLSQLLNDPLYQLQIVSFKLLDNGEPFVSIFDKAGNFIIIKYQNNEWMIHSQDQIGITDALKFDFKVDRLYQPEEYLIVDNQRVTVIKYQNNLKVSFQLPLIVDLLFNAWIIKDNYLIYSLSKITQLVIEGTSLKYKSSVETRGLWTIPDHSSNQFTTLTALYNVNQQQYVRSNGKSAGVFNLVQNTDPVCTVKVTLAKLGDFGIAIREPGFESMKNVLYGGTERQYYYENYDGADIKYTQNIIDLRVQLHFIKQIDLTITMEEEEQTVSIFKQLLTVPDEPKTFYQIQQFTDLRVLILVCVYNEEPKDGKCSFHKEYQENIRLNTQNAYFYINDLMIRGSIIQSEIEFIDYRLSPRHSYFNEVDLANVKAISVSQNYVYAITDTVTYIYYISPYVLIFQFSTDFGLQNVQRIFTSPHHNKIVVQTDNKFWVGQVEDISYYFTFAFDYNQLNRVTAVVFENNFVIINVDAMNNIQMYQYDFQDLYNIKQQFIIPTYDYKIEGAIQLTSDLLENYYLVVTNAANTQYKILNFRMTSVSSSTLYQVITTEQPALITACKNILLVQTEEGDKYVTIPSQMKVQTIFNLPQSEYFSTYNIEIYPETNNNEKIKIIQPLNIVWTQEVISLDAMKIKIDNKNFNSDDKCSDLGTTFYNGEVTHFLASCETCKDGTVYIENRVQLSKGLLGSLSDIVEAIQLDEEHVAILSKNHLTIHKLPYWQDIKLPTDCVGQRILPNSDGSQLYIICKRPRNQDLLTYTCSKSICTQQAELQLPEGMNVLGFTVLDSFVYLVYDDRILTYLITNNQVELKSTIMTSSSGVSYVQAVRLTITIKQLYLTFAQSIQVIEFQNINNVFTEIQRFTINLNDLLITNKKYLSDDTQFISSPIYEVVIQQNQDIALKLILISSNTAHYGLQLSYNCDLDKCTKAKPYEIPYMINQYLDWKAIYGQVSNGYLGIVYQNSGQLIQAAYLLPETLTGLPETMIGAVSTISVISVPVIQNKIAYLLTINEYNHISLNSLKSTPRFCVLDNLEKQYVTITAHNDKETSSTKFILQVSYDKTETSDGGSLVWLWVLLGLAVAGGVGFGLWKVYSSKKSKTTDLGLLN